MVKLEVEPKGALSWELRVRSGGRELTTLAVRRLRDGGRFMLDGVEHTVVAEGFLQRAFRLERGALRIARADTRGFLRPVFTIVAGDRTLHMRPKGFLGFTYVVEHNRTPMGVIERTSAFRRHATAELDDRIDPATRIFMIFLTQIQWRRQARHSS